MRAVNTATNISPKFFRPRREMRFLLHSPDIERTHLRRAHRMQSQRLAECALTWWTNRLKGRTCGGGFSSRANLFSELLLGPRNQLARTAYFGSRRFGERVWRRRRGAAGLQVRREKLRSQR